MIKDLTGQRFGRLVVIKRAANKKRAVCWECLCDCGKTHIVRSTELCSGKTKSCGCLNKENTIQRNTKHGGKTRANADRLYYVWQKMRLRCCDEKDKSYKNYGGRGISVCDEWRNDYAAFKAWALANGYNENAKRGQCTLDRIDVNGNYCPENCRWVSMAEQQQNKRNNRLITYNGETRTMAEWARFIGISAGTLHNRLKKWGVEKALSTPANTRKKEV